MLKLFSHSHTCSLYAPVIGRSVSLSAVPDPVFSNRLLGDGIAFEYEGDTIYSPCDAVILLIANTCHAIGMRLKNGMEIMIHVGLETVHLKGEGFKVFVRPHQKVKRGEPLMKIDRSLMKERNIDLITLMIVTKTNGFSFEISNNQEVTLDSVVLEAEKSR